MNITTRWCLTHFVNSNILKSNGSPVNSPSICVSEWQVAIAWTNLSSVSNWHSVTGSVNFEAMQGNAEWTSRPSWVKVPVYKIQWLYKVWYFFFCDKNLNIKTLYIDTNPKLWSRSILVILQNNQKYREWIFNSIQFD